MDNMSVIVFVYNKEDQGISIAHNNGTAVETGKYIVFDDVDNYIEVDS